MLLACGRVFLIQMGLLGQRSSFGSLFRRGCLWRHVDDHFLVSILVSIAARRVMTWRLQLHAAAQRQHQAHWKAQQEHDEAQQQKQLQAAR